MKKYFTVATALILLGLLASVFYYAEFYAAQSETSAEKETITVSSHQELLATRGRVPLTLFVPGDGPLEASLGRELRAELSKSPFFAEVVFQPGRAQAVAGDVLVVDLGSCQMTWTGFYSRTSVAVTANYSTTGKVERDNRSEPVQLYGDKPTVITTAKLTVEDTSRGLMSLPGYDAELGRKLAREVARSLLAEIQRQIV